MVRFYTFSTREMYSGVLSQSELERAKSLPMDVGGDWEPTYELELPTVKEKHAALTLRVNAEKMVVGEYSHSGWVTEFYEEDFIDEPEVCIGHLVIHPSSGHIPIPEEEVLPEDVEAFRAVLEEELDEEVAKLERIKSDLEDDEAELREQLTEAENLIEEISEGEEPN